MKHLKWLTVIMATLVLLASVPVFGAAEVNDTNMEELELYTLTGIGDGKIFLTGQTLDGDFETMTAFTVSCGGKYAFLAYLDENHTTVYRLNLETMVVTASWQGEGAVTDMVCDTSSNLYLTTATGLTVLKIQDMTVKATAAFAGAEQICVSEAGTVKYLYVLSGDVLTRYNVTDLAGIAKDDSFGEDGSYDVSGESAATADGDLLRIKHVTDMAEEDGFIYLACEVAGGTGNGGVLLMDRKGSQMIGAASATSALALDAAGDYVMLVTADRTLNVYDKDTLEMVSESAYIGTESTPIAVSMVNEAAYFGFGATDSDTARIMEAPLTKAAYDSYKAVMERQERVAFDTCDSLDYWNLTQCAQEASLQTDNYLEGKAAVTATIKGGNLVICSCRSPKLDLTALDASGYEYLTVCIYATELQENGFTADFVFEMASQSEGSPDGPGESQRVQHLHQGWNYVTFKLGGNTDLSSLDFFRMYNVGIEPYIPAGGSFTVYVDAVYLTKDPASLDLSDTGTDNEITEMVSSREKTGEILTAVSDAETSGTSESGSAASEKKGCGSVLTTGSILCMLVVLTGSSAYIFRKRK